MRDKWEVKFGRRRSDGVIWVPFGASRFLIRADVRWVEGIPLEPIDADARGKFVAVVLVKREWYPNLYFLNERTEWEEDDYFLHAQDRIWALKLGGTNGNQHRT